MRAAIVASACLLLGVVLTAQAPSTRVPYRTWSVPASFPLPPVPADNPLTDAKVDLGRHLFYDTRLSGNGTQACATCHEQARAFADARGVGLGSTGQFHTRGSMSLVNVAYASVLTWANPRMTRLEDQALVPMYGDAPVELGLGADDRMDDDARQ
ncbi:MAG: cytochrome-c peroxidase [Vicinamibacterales bacterium]